MTKIGKICKWTALIVFALITLGIVSLWLFFPVEKAKRYAIEKGTQLLEREIEIETASVSFWGGVGIRLDHIVIKNQNGFSDDNLLTAKSLDVKLQFFALVIGDLAIDRLILKDPQINLYKKQNGQNNFTFKNLEKKVPPEIVKQASPETKAAAGIVTFENIELQNGTVLYQDDSTKTTINLNGLNLLSTLTHPYDNQYSLSGELVIDELQVANKMNLPHVELILKYEAEINQLENSITISNTELSLNKIKTNISGTLENIYSAITAKINMQAEQIAIKNILNIVPAEKKELITPYKVDGKLSFDFDIESSPKEFLYFGTATLHDVTVEHNEIVGKFLCEEAMVDIKNNNLRFNITKGEFDGKPLKGILTVDDFKNPFINSVFAGSLNLKYLEPFLPIKEEHRLNGIADFDVKVSGLLSDVSNLKFHGELQAENVAYNSAFMLEPIDSLSLEIRFDNEIVSIKKLSALTQSGSFTLGGRITSLTQYLLADSLSDTSVNPTIDAKLIGKLKLSVLNKILPPKGNPELQGDLFVDMQLSGAVNDLSLFKPFGDVVIRNGSYADDLLPEKIENFEAQLTISPDTITVRTLQAQFETSDAEFKGKLINPFPYLLPIKNINRKKIRKPLFVFTLKSNRFDADKLFPEAVPGVGNEKDVVTIDSISTIIFPDIDGRGTFSVDTLIYSKVLLTSLAGKLNIENKSIECYDVKGDVYDGKIEGNTTIDLTDFNDPHYVGNFNAMQIEVNDFANRFSKLQNILFGKIDMKGTYNANGWKPEQFLNSLTMNSASTIRQGKVKLSGDIFSQSQKLFEKFGSNLQKEQTIKNLFTNIIVEDGKVSFDKLSTKLGEIGDLEIGGFYNFNGNISYNCKIKFSKDYSNRITKNISDDFTFLFPIGGTIDDPAFNIDLSTMLKGSAKGFLKDLLK